MSRHDLKGPERRIKTVRKYFSYWMNFTGAGVFTARKPGSIPLRREYPRRGLLIKSDVIYDKIHNHVRV